MKAVTHHRAFRLPDNPSGGALSEKDDVLLRRMNGSATHLVFPRGAIVFSQGMPPATLFLVCEGQLQLSIGSPAGRSVFVGLAGPGDVLGLSSIINNIPYEITAEAVRPTVAKSVGRAEFLGLMNGNPEIAVRAAQALAKECHSLLYEARRLALPGTARGRLAQLMLDWAGSVGDNASSCSVDVSCTHEQMGMMIAATRETVTRLINQFENEGIIRREGALLEILRPEVLKRLTANGTGVIANGHSPETLQTRVTATEGP